MLSLLGAGCASHSGSSSSPPKPEAATAGAPETGSRPLTDAERAAHLASFDQIYTTIRDTHWDPAQVGPAWDAAHAELRPRVEAAKTADEARAAMRDLIATLHQSHFSVIPTDVYEHLDPSPNTAAAAGHGDIGVSIRVADNAALITAVRPGSSGAAAGLRPGMIVVTIDGRSLSDILRAPSPDDILTTLRPALLSRAVEARLAGPIGSPVTLDLLAEGDKRITLSVPRAEPAGNPSKFGNLPTIYVTYDQRRIEGDIGYITFSAFLDMPRVMERFNSAIAEFADTRALIIDIRGNPGGIGLMATAMGGWFITKHDLRLGTMKTRDLAFNFVLQPRLQPYTRPLAILVDECSLSTSEIFAGGMQDLLRARVFGVQTGGAALPSVIERLPNGDGFQHAIADYVSTSGRPLEAAGVIPDVPVPYNRDLLLTGHDPILEAALDWIHSLPRR